jgi:hypothetical protein
LDGTLERSGPERGVEAALDEELHGVLRDVELDLLDAEAFLDLSEQDADDLPHVVAREGMEHDDVIDSIQELRVERALELVVDRALDGGELLHASLGLFEPEVAAAGNDLSTAQIRGHDGRCS